MSWIDELIAQNQQGLLTQPPEDEEDGVLSRLGHAALVPLQWIAETLDKPGRALRGVLGGKPSELLNLIPFSDTLGITDPSTTVSGRDLLRQGGMIGSEDNFGNWLGGLGVEILTDPLNLLSFGSKAALTTAGKEAAKAGQLLPTASARLAGETPQAAGMMALQTPFWWNLFGGPKGSMPLLTGEAGKKTAAFLERQSDRIADLPGMSTLGSAFQYARGFTGDKRFYKGARGMEAAGVETAKHLGDDFLGIQRPQNEAINEVVGRFGAQASEVEDAFTHLFHQRQAEMSPALAQAGLVNETQPILWSLPPDLRGPAVDRLDHFAKQAAESKFYDKARTHQRDLGIIVPEAPSAWETPYAHQRQGEAGRDLHSHQKGRTLPHEVLYGGERQLRDLVSQVRDHRNPLGVAGLARDVQAQEALLADLRDLTKFPKQGEAAAEAFWRKGVTKRMALVDEAQIRPYQELLKAMEAEGLRGSRLAEDATPAMEQAFRAAQDVAPLNDMEARLVKYVQKQKDLPTHADRRIHRVAKSAQPGVLDPKLLNYALEQFTEHHAGEVLTARQAVLEARAPEYLAAQKALEEAKAGPVTRAMTVEEADQLFRKQMAESGKAGQLPPKLETIEKKLAETLKKQMRYGDKHLDKVRILNDSELKLKQFIEQHTGKTVGPKAAAAEAVAAARPALKLTGDVAADTRAFYDQAVTLGDGEFKELLGQLPERLTALKKQDLVQVAERMEVFGAKGMTRQQAIEEITTKIFRRRGAADRATMVHRGAARATGTGGPAPAAVEAAAVRGNPTMVTDEAATLARLEQAVGKFDEAEKALPDSLKELVKLTPDTVRTQTKALGHWLAEVDPAVARSGRGVRRPDPAGLALEYKLNTQTQRMRADAVLETLAREAKPTAQVLGEGGDVGQLKTIRQVLDEIGLNAAPGQGAKGGRLAALERLIGKGKSTVNVDDVAGDTTALGKALDEQAVPADLVEVLQKELAGPKGSKPGGLLDKLDKALAAFRSFVTVPFPSYHLRNTGDAFLQQGLHGGFDKTAVRDVADFLAGGVKDPKLADELRRYGEEALVHDAAFRGQPLELLGKGVDARGNKALAPFPDQGKGSVREAVGGFFKDFKKGAVEGQRYATLDPTKNQMVQQGVKAHLASDQLTRFSQFVALRRQGLAPEVAAKKVGEAQLKYSRMTDFEQKLMRRLLPFYSFSKENVLRTGRQLQDPGAISQLIRTVTSARDDQVIPDWAAAGGVLPAGTTEDGKQRVVGGFGLALEDELLGGLVSLLALNPKKAAQKALSGLEPLSKTLIEQGTNTQLYSGRRLSDQEPNKLLSFLPRPLAVALTQAAGATPAARIMTTADKLGKGAVGDKGGLETLANLLTGVRVSAIDPAQTKNLAAREALDRLLDQTGQVAHRTDTYLKPEYKENASSNTLALLKLQQLLERDAQARQKQKAAAR